MRQSLPVLLLATLLTACLSVVSSAAQRVGLDSEVTLAPRAAAVTSDGFEARFTGVSEDSRCPTDMTCVWGGEVKVQLEIRGADQPPAQHEVLEGGEVVVAGHRVTLVRVRPQPLSTRKIMPEEYRVTLKISAA